MDTKQLSYNERMRILSERVHQALQNDSELTLVPKDNEVYNGTKDNYPFPDPIIPFKY